MPSSLYIDGKWTAGSGGTADVLNPFDASVVETVDQAGPDDVEAAVAAARAAFDDPRGWRAAPVARAGRAAAPRRGPAPARQGAHRPHRDARHRQDARREPHRRRRRDGGVPLLRRPRRHPGGPDGRRRAAARALPDRARAGRRLRADHAVELPAAAAVVEARARARRRLHLRDQAQRGHAADVACCSCALAEEAGVPPGVVNILLGTGPAGRCAAHRAPGRGHGQLHRRPRHRAGDHPGVGGDREAGRAWSWAARTRTSCSPTPTSRPSSTTR